MAKYQGRFEKVEPKKQRKGWGFVIFMILYAVVFLGAAAWGLDKFWDYMEAYEASRVRNTIEAYMDTVTPEYVAERSGDLIDRIDHHLQSEEACAEVIKQAVSGGISYARKTGECTDTLNVYVLRSGGKVIGRVELEPKGEAVYGFTPWAVKSDSFDLSFLIGSTDSITVPHVLQVYAGDALLNESYITATGLEYEALDGYYDEFELPYKVTYEAGPILGETVLTAADAEGNPVQITPETDLNAYVNNCDEATAKELDAFCRKFIGCYTSYLTSRNDNRWYNYYQLEPLLVEGSGLATRVKNALAGLEFGQSQSDKIVSITIHYLTDVGDSRYFCDVTYEVDSMGTDGQYTRTVNNAQLIVLRTADGLKAERLLSY